MTYPIEKLATIAECDTLLTYANNEKKTLEYRKYILDYSQGNAAENADLVNVSIQAAQVELQGLESLITTLPDGDAKEEYLRKRKRLENKLDDLGFKREDAGAGKLLTKMLELAQINAQLAETENFITAVTARKAALS